MPKVILGCEPFISFWKIVSIEADHTGGPVLTIKSLYSLGSLPKLIEAEIPQEVLPRLHNALNHLEDTIHRGAAVDVIDACRDALSIIFSAKSEQPTMDLSNAIRAYIAGDTKNREVNVASSAGRIVARLHARRKPCEQNRLELRAPVDDDASLAVRCLGVVLLDFGWGC